MIIYHKEVKSFLKWGNLVSNLDCLAGRKFKKTIVKNCKFTLFSVCFSTR